MKKKKKLLCVFIDFEKAFDTVWREGLWCKLPRNYINGKMNNVIDNIYHDVKSRIMHNNEFSDLLHVGMLADKVILSSFLFSLYLNDLETFLENNNNYFI